LSRFGGLGRLDVSELPRGQVEQRLLALIELDAGRQTLAYRLDQVALSHRNRS
jgi:hypothetical protein